MNKEKVVKLKCFYSNHSKTSWSSSFIQFLCQHFNFFFKGKLLLSFFFYEISFHLLVPIFLSLPLFFFFCTQPCSRASRLKFLHASRGNKWAGERDEENEQYTKKKFISRFTKIHLIAIGIYFWSQWLWETKKKERRKMTTKFSEKHKLGSHISIALNFGYPCDVTCTRWNFIKSQKKNYFFFFKHNWIRRM